MKVVFFLYATYRLDGGARVNRSEWKLAQMTKTQNTLVSECFSATDKESFAKHLQTLQKAVDAYPAAKIEDIYRSKEWSKIQDWTSWATNSVFQIFNLLAHIDYRTKQMDEALEDARFAFYAAFRLVFWTENDPEPMDYHVAKTAFEACLASGQRLL